MPTLAVLNVFDRASGGSHELTLGEFQAVWAARIWFGRDPGCTVVLDAPGIRRFHAIGFSAGHHRYLAIIPEDAVWPRPIEDGPNDPDWMTRRSSRVDGGAFTLGDFTLSFGERTVGELDPSDPDPAPPQGARFSRQRAPRPVAAPPQRFGPNTPRVESALSRFSALRCLEPDAETEALTSHARMRVEESLDAHRGALSVVTDAADKRSIRWRPEEALRVEYARSLSGFARRWALAWSALPSQGASDYLEAFHAAGTRAFMEPWPQMQGWAGTSAQTDLRGALESAARARFGADSAWSQRVRPTMSRVERVGLPAPLELVHLELCRLAAGDDHASPWGPLIELWASGVWPVALPGGAFLVYVPVLDARGVVTEPEGAPVEIPARPPPLPNGLRLEESFFNAAAVMLYRL